MKNPEKKRGRYLNPHVHDLKRKWRDIILWRLGYYDEKEPRSPLPSGFFYPGEAPLFDPHLPTATWIGHSTYLIQINDTNILTDPVFDSHCSPFPLKPFKRQHDVPFEIDELPPIDFIVLSHNHYDHLDKKSIRRLHRRHPQATFIVPQGVLRWFSNQGIHPVKELAWGETVELGGTRITAVPAQHHSGRNLFDQNRTLWCGYVIESCDKTVYFVGDTGYNPMDFKRIGERFSNIDLSLIPIGTYVPEKFMKAVHISPFEAVQIHLDVGSRLSLGMHWKTFLLSDEPPNRPPYDLYLAMAKHGLPFDTFLPIEPGEHVNF